MGGVIQREDDFEPLDPDISVSAIMDESPDFGVGTTFYQIRGPAVTLSTLSAAINAGKIYYSLDNGATKVKVTEAKINELWDKKYKAPFSRSGSLDWSKNCAEYATGTSSHEGDIAKTKTYLSTNYTTVVPSINAYQTVAAFTEKFKTLDTGEYVVNLANHFLKVEISSSGVKLSQKDGESCIYTANLTADLAAKLLYDDFNNGIIYKK